MRYVALDDGVARFYTLAGERVGTNGASFAPLPGGTRVSLRAEDASGHPIALGVCQEWTYDKAEQHPSYRCLPRACAPVLDVPLEPRPPGATYHRVLVFVFDEPWGCGSRATVGVISATFA